MTGFCVYTHARATDSVVFYVGKGSLKRAKTKNGRSAYWHRIVNKYGYVTSIVKSDLSEACAFTLEKCLIAIYGRVNLCNMTDGGQGVSGRKMSDAQKARASARFSGKPLPADTIEAARKRNFKKVGTRCGLVFESVTHAANFANPSNWRAAKVSISAAANGKIQNAYGYEWGFIQLDGSPSFKYVNKMSDPRPKRWKAVSCSNGLETKVFGGVTIARSWLIEQGFGKSSTGGICQACIRGGNYQGYRWSYV